LRRRPQRDEEHRPEHSAPVHHYTQSVTERLRGREGERLRGRDVETERGGRKGRRGSSRPVSCLAPLPLFCPCVWARGERRV